MKWSVFLFIMMINWAENPDHTSTCQADEYMSLFFLYCDLTPVAPADAYEQWKFLFLRLRRCGKTQHFYQSTQGFSNSHAMMNEIRTFNYPSNATESAAQWLVSPTTARDHVTRMVLYS